MQENNVNNKHNDSLSALIDLIPDSIVIIDSAGKIIAASKSVEEFTGYKSEKLVGKNFLDLSFLDKEEKPHSLDEMKKRLVGSRIPPYEVKLKLKNGDLKILDVTGKKIEYEGTLCDIVIFHDITEHSKHQRQLQQNLLESQEKIQASELKYKTLYDLAPDSIVTFDESGIITSVNRAALEYTGFTESEVIGKHFSKLTMLKAKDIPKYFKIFFAVKRGKNPKPFEVAYKTKAGIELVSEVHLSVIREKGKLAGAVAVSRDRTSEKKAKQALHENEEKFHAITNSVRDAVILINEEAKVTYWNPAAEKIFGYSSEEAVGRCIHELVVPISMPVEGRRRIEEGVKIFSKTGMGYFTVGNVEVVARRRDNSEFPAKLAISPIKLGEKWNAVGVVKDITKRKQNDQKLRDAEQRYHALFNQAPIGVTLVDPTTGNIVEFNNVAYEQLHYSKEEFGELAIPDIEAKESPSEIRKHLEQMIREGGGEFETKHRAKDGEIRDVLVTTRIVELAGKFFLHCIFHDITEIKTVQKALMESETQYRQLVQLAQEGIWAFDNNCTTVFVNPRMAQMLGYSESEFFGKSVFELIDDIDAAKQFLSQIKGPIDGKFEYAFLHKDGKRIHATIAASTILDDKGQVSGALALVSDITERKQAERALKESVELSKAIVANAPIGIATSDQSYHFLSANEAFCRILGYTEQELRGMTFKEVTDPADAQESIRKMVEFESSKRSFVQEKHYIKKDGTTILGRVIVNAIFNSNGKPMLFIVELEDITQQKQLEGDLKASEERFRAISTSAMDAIVLINDDDKIIYWNPGAERTFGFSEKEAIGKQIVDLVIAPQELEKYAMVRKELAADQFSKKHFEALSLRKDGIKVPTDISIASVNLREKRCLLAIVRDISERKAMEEALKQERDMLENMAANIGAGLTIIDRNYRILYANEVLRRNTQNVNLENKACYSVYGNSTGTCPDCGVKKVFEKGATVDRHDFNIKNGGYNGWIELIVTPVKDKEGNIIAALELAVDVTERKRLQKKLADYSQRLEELVQKRTELLRRTQAELVKSERLAAIGELAGMIGHDLRNPLTGIKNSAYFMKKKGSEISPTQAKEMLDIIDKCVDYSNKIVSDLLDYSREIRLDFEICTLNDLVSDSLAMVNRPEKIKIVNNVQEEIQLKVDGDKMKRVFINLIKNAFDAMPAGGTITIASKQTNENIEVSFADTGTGISTEVLPKIFSPLFTTKAQGMGFGLAICKRIVEAHGGNITVQTTQGKGTIFTVILKKEQKIETGGEKNWIMMPKSSLSMTMKQ